MYWAQKLATQNTDANLKAQFAPIAKALTENEETIVNELKIIQGKPVDIKGYYLPNEELTVNAMRASATLNSILSAI